MQAHPRGFENRDSGIHNQPGIYGMISEKVIVKRKSLKKRVLSEPPNSHKDGHDYNEMLQFILVMNIYLKYISVPGHWQACLPTCMLVWRLAVMHAHFERR